MKKILFVAFAATLLAAGCQKTEIINHVPGDAMTFSTGMSKLTKADNTGDLTTLKAQDFSVWAYYAADDQHTAADDKSKVYDKIANVKVSDNDAGKWGTTEQYYWPGVGKELIFFAVSADETTIGTTTFDTDGTETTTSKVKISDDRTSLEIENFEVNNEAPYVDLMIADVVQQHQGDKVVDLNFHHALAKVEFLFKTITNEDNLTVTVNSLSVADVKTKGTFSTVQSTQAKSGDDTTGDDTTGGGTTTTYSGTQTEVGFYWTGQDVAKAFSVKNKDALESFVLTDEYQTYSTWMVIPQGISTTKVTVNYTIGGKTFDSIFDLYTTDLTKWEPNQYIAYRITLAPNLITFNPSVDDWDPVQNEDRIN